MVEIDDADRAHPGRGEVEDQRAAEPARADHQHPRFEQPRLACPADLAQHDMPRVALELLVAEQRTFAAGTVVHGALSSMDTANFVISRGCLAVHPQPDCGGKLPLLCWLGVG